MSTEKILYTDEGEVVVTDSALRVRNRSYQLDGITKHSFSIIKPNISPGLFLIGLGLIALALSIGSNLKLANATVPAGSAVAEATAILGICAGIFIVAGIVITIAKKEKYGVHIVTANGETDVLVSDRKEYVSRIVEALNKAVINTIGKTD